MSSLKIHDAFNGYGLQSNIIASEIIAQYLKGENFIPFEKFREIGMSEREISQSLNELREAGIIRVGCENPEMWEPIDSSVCAGINVTNLSLASTFAQNNQPSLPTEKKQPEFTEGTDDHRIGHALYRASVKKAEAGWTLCIDRYTIDPAHVGDETPTVFCQVRHILELDGYDNAEAAWQDWSKTKTATKATFSIGVDGPPEESDECIDIAGVDHTFLITEEDHEPGVDWTAGIYKRDGDQYLLVAEHVGLPDLADCYSAWETALDDLWPAEKLTGTQATLEVVEGDALEITHEFNLEVNEIKVSCTFSKGIKQDTVEALWNAEGGKAKTKKYTIKQDRPTSKSQLETMTKTWLQGVLA